MPLPPELLRAVAQPPGGRVVLVLGAGCSMEPPTSLRSARDYALEAHRQLRANGILQQDCANPEDLSCVADAVVAATGSQVGLINCLPLQLFRLADANDGYLLAAALLREGAVASVLTLNFDLALNAALTQVGSRGDVTIISGPEEHANMTAVNVIYLHRNAYSLPERWILRTTALDQEWRDAWEQVIAQRVLTTPVVVFAGLGTPAAVLIQTVRTIRQAVPAGITIYQVDRSDRATSRFFAEMALADEAYLQMEWGAFMRQLSARVLAEHDVSLARACQELVANNGWHAEDVATLSSRLAEHGLLVVGRIRARWLLVNSPYLPARDLNWAWLADLLLAVGFVERTTGTQAAFADDGLLELRTNGRTLASIVLAHGRGSERWHVVEAELQRLRWSQIGKQSPRFAVVSGIPNGRPALVAPPGNILFEQGSGSIIMAETTPQMLSVDELRADPALLQRLVG